MLSRDINALLDAKCGSMSITATESKQIIGAALQRQAKTGIVGHENLKGFGAMEYCALFKTKIKAAHTDALAVLNSSSMWAPLRDIPPYVDRLLRPFVDDVSQRVVDLVGDAKFSREEKDIPAVYASLKKEFEHQAELAVRSRRKDAITLGVIVSLLTFAANRVWDWCSK